MSKRIKIPEITTAYGYVGVWGSGGPLGWFMPQHLHPMDTRQNPEAANPEMAKCSCRCRHAVVQVAVRDSRAFLCRITIVPVFNRKGRPVTRIVRPK